MSKGKYIVIEGTEGVGKTTMVNLIAQQLQAAQLPVKVMREPDSQNDLTARALRRLVLDPRYPMTTKTEVLLFNAARVQSLEIIRDAVANGITCLVDRSYLTTLANQYYGRGDITDYQKINDIIEFAVGDMQPDLMVILDAPVQTIRERINNRSISHGRFGLLDEGFYERVRAGYLWEAKQRNLPVIYATDGIDTVFKQVWKLVAETMAVRDRAANKPQSVAEVLAAKNQSVLKSEPPVVTPPDTKPAEAGQEQLVTRNENGSYHITDSGRRWLEGAVTNLDSNVYAALPKLDSVTAAAAMARLSRRGDDMRVTILDEFANNADKDQQLLNRVITAFGDDSVQQLVGQHIVVENASNLLTKKLERGRLASYLEQSTRYIYYDQKDEAGNYRYFVPPEFKGKIRASYTKTMDQIFDLYSKMVNELTDYVRKSSNTPEEERDAAWRSATKAQACDAIRPVLPVATKSTVGIYASGQSLEGLIMRLLGDDLPEARTVGQQILDEARKVISVFLERADKPERGGAIIAYSVNTRNNIKKLADELLPTNYTPQSTAVSLIDYSPRNELDIVPDMLYEHSDLPLEQLQAEVVTWPYERKLEVFNAYMGERLNRRHRPGRALEKIHYSWDLMCDYGIFRDLQRHRMVDDMEWQQLTPRYGYEIPKLVEEASLVDDFEACFDLSLQLYSALQAAGLQLEAQYATLLGHRMRWKVTYNAREAFHLHELRTSPQGHPGYRKLVLEMHEKLAEVHPLLAEAMKFVNQDEDPALTRLAAERYTQYKLDVLDGKEAKKPKA
ncbi:MAG: dTMP kinase [Candidatus Saccharimonadales bacterium]